MDMSLKSATLTVIKDTNGNTFDSCPSSTIKMATSNTGGENVAVTGSVTAANLTWSGCTWTTTTTQGGTLSVSATSPNGSGTVKASGFKVTVNGLLGDCVYQTGENLTLGTVVGGNPATLEIKGVPLTETSGFCPTSEVWTATYVSTEPAGTLHVANK